MIGCLDLNFIEMEMLIGLGLNWYTLHKVVYTYVDLFSLFQKSLTPRVISLKRWHACHKKPILTARAIPLTTVMFLH